MNGIAARVIANPGPYGARFNTLAVARKYINRIPNAGSYRIIMGTDQTFWIMPGRIARALIDAGLEQITQR